MKNLNTNSPVKAIQPRSELPIHDRTVETLNQIQTQILQHVTGLDRIVISQAIPVLRPRLEARIRSASEGALKEQLVYMRDLLNRVLDEETSKPVPAKKKKKKTTTSKKTAASKRSKGVRRVKGGSGLR